MTDSFVGYIQEPDIHDGVILRVQNRGVSVRVLVKAHDDRHYAIEFHGVQSLRSHQPEGMMVYSLSELAAAAPPWRRFAFTDWEESGGRFLEVTAERFKSYEVAGESAF